MEELEIPEVIVSALGLSRWLESARKRRLSLIYGEPYLGDLVVGLRLSSMDHIRELNSILNEEDRYVIADNIPVSFRRVKLKSKATDIANCIGTATASQDSRESLKDWSPTTSIGQDWSTSVLLQTFVHLEGTESASATGVDDTFWDSLVVEAGSISVLYPPKAVPVATQDVPSYFLPSHVVLQQLRASVVLIRDREPMVGVGLFDTEIGGEPVARIMVVLHVLLEVRHFRALESAIELIAELLEPVGYCLSHCEFFLADGLMAGKVKKDFKV